MDFFINSMHKGGWFMWPILILALCSLLLAAHQLFMRWRVSGGNAALWGQVMVALEVGDLDEAQRLCRSSPRSAVGQVLDEIIAEHREGVDNLHRVADYATMTQRSRLRTHSTSLLPAIASIVTLVGLTGTVQGLILSMMDRCLGGCMSCSPDGIFGLLLGY